MVYEFKKDCFLCKKYPCHRTNEIHELAKEIGIRVTCNSCDEGDFDC